MGSNLTLIVRSSFEIGLVGGLCVSGHLDHLVQRSIIDPPHDGGVEDTQP